MILFESPACPIAARDALAKVRYKMPSRCRLVTRRPSVGELRVHLVPQTRFDD